ncbi:hypothetical protein [Ralstonia insidiosa]|jgi:hypothetical protein|nr:hypothetical protein [Ralstonia insidiosa]MBX3904984.1 hypothetical protein [Ralstonia insidiosa]
MSHEAKRKLERGAKFPYDAPDSWWRDDGESPPAATDWAHAAARGILADLKGRSGVDDALQNVDEETRMEIVQSIADIIRTAQSET